VQRVVDLLVEHGGGVADGPVTDVDERLPRQPVLVPEDLAARVVGVAYPREQVVETLEMIGCAVADGGPGLLEITPPSWRPDLVEPVTFVEEVARLRGYDAIDSVLPVAPA